MDTTLTAASVHGLQLPAMGQDKQQGIKLASARSAGTHVSALGFLHILLVHLYCKWDSGQNFKAKETF